MFCTKCGNQCPDNEQFCSNCGARLNIVEHTEQTTKNQGVFIKEYFLSYCSEKATKRQKIIKILGIVSLAIQSILFLLAVIVVSYTCVLFIGTGVPVVMFPSLVLFLVLFIVPSFIFTIKGIQKKSPGFLIASLFFAFIAALFGSALGIGFVSVNRIVGCVILIIHISMIVLNSKNVKEYKNYLIKSST